MQKKNLFRSNRLSAFLLGFLELIVSKILTFSYTFLSVRRPSRKTSYYSYLPQDLKEKIPFKR